MTRCSCFFSVGKWFFISSRLAWVCSYLNKSSAPSFCVWRKWSTWNAGNRDLWQVRGSLTLWRLGVRDSSSWLVCEALPPWKAWVALHLSEPSATATSLLQEKWHRFHESQCACLCVCAHVLHYLLACLIPRGQWAK